MTADDATFEGRVAIEIDRLVIGGHARAAEWPTIAALREEPEWSAGAAPMLTTFGAPLLVRPLRAEQFSLVLRYLRPERGSELFEANVAAGALARDGSLTTRGRELAEVTVRGQEDVMADIWSAAPDALGAADGFLAHLTPEVERLTPLRSPSAVEVFHGTADRDRDAARVLRSITLLRYWRMDAHAVAQETAGLTPPEAHTLNRAWMASNGIDDLPGQGTSRLGSSAVESLARRGLLSGESITDAGRAVRVEVERITDEHMAKAYAPLDEEDLVRLLNALTALPH